jgi:ATP/maltotriose-dependent transcriptional regulator MalT
MAPLLAQLLVWEGSRQQARSQLETALRAARSMRIAHVEDTATAHLARLDLLEGHPEAALTRLQPLHSKDLPWSHAVALLSTLAAAHLDLGDPDRAQPHAERAVTEARRPEGWFEGIRALEVSGTIQARRGNHALADAAYQEGLQRARAIPSTTLSAPTDPPPARGLPLRT